MRLLRTITSLCVAMMSIILPLTKARAQSVEEKFQDLFVTAGYCTAFGAAIGTAALAWEPDPAANLRYVAMGASLGFLGGSALGTYIIFMPSFADSSPRQSETLAMNVHSQFESRPSLLNAPRRGRALVVKPVLDRQSWKPVGIEGVLSLAEF